MTKQTTRLNKWFVEWCKTWSLHVDHDIIEKVVGGEEVCVPCCTLMDEHDPSVGIFGEHLSPLFNTVGALATWCEKHHKEVEAYLDCAWGSADFRREAAEILRGGTKDWRRTVPTHEPSGD